MMKLRIIVIDDELSIRETFKMHLEMLGHEVLVASEPMLCDLYQGHDCDEELACCDMLFVDYKMPRMNGLEFVELMVSRGCQSVSKNTIIMSGNVGAIDAVKAKELGCQIIQKPLSLSYVDRLVEEASQKVDPNRKLADILNKKPSSPLNCVA